MPYAISENKTSYRTCLNADDILKGEVFSETVPNLPLLNAALRKEAILAELAAIDAKCIRPMVEGDAVFLAKLRAPVQALRDELKTL